MKLSLKQAAEQTGRSKSTVFRACKDGRISFSRDDAGSMSIDASELFRVFDPQRSATAVERHEALQRNAETQHETSSAAAVLEAQIVALRELLNEKDRVISDLRGDRDRWANQAERLAITGPKASWWSRMTSS